MAFSRKKIHQSKSTTGLNELHVKTKTGTDILHLSPRTTNNDVLNETTRTRNLPRSTYRSNCPCDNHFTRTLLDRKYNLPVDHLFQLMFGSNPFVREYRKAQHFLDETETEWEINQEKNVRERVLKYKVPYEAALIGRRDLMTREEQRIYHEVAGSFYVVETEVFNEGVQYSDAFFLTIRYCMVQISEYTTHLRVTANVSFTKSINVVVKKIIERNAYGASQAGVKDLDSRLLKQMATPLAVDENSTTTTLDELPISATIVTSTNHSAEIKTTVTHPDRVLYIAVFLLCCLFFIHLHLYVKLTRVDFLLDTLLYSTKPRKL